MSQKRTWWSSWSDLLLGFWLCNCSATTDLRQTDSLEKHRQRGERVINIPAAITNYSHDHNTILWSILYGFNTETSTCVWRRVMLNHQMISRARKQLHYSQIPSIMISISIEKQNMTLVWWHLPLFLFYAQFYTVHILQWLNPALVITNKRLISHSSKVCVSHYREQICVYIAYLWFSFRMIV